MAKAPKTNAATIGTVTTHPAKPATPAPVMEASPASPATPEAETAPATPEAPATPTAPIMGEGTAPSDTATGKPVISEEKHALAMELAEKLSEANLRFFVNLTVDIQNAKSNLGRYVRQHPEMWKFQPGTRGKNWTLTSGFDTDAMKEFKKADKKGHDTVKSWNDALIAFTNLSTALGLKQSIVPHELVRLSD
jgi:hypothetical protein